jgi:hypothetical protein
VPPGRPGDEPAPPTSTDPPPAVRKTKSSTLRGDFVRAGRALLKRLEKTEGK